MPLPTKAKMLRATGIVSGRYARWKGDDHAKVPEHPPSVYFTVDQATWSTLGPDMSRFPYEALANMYFGSMRHGGDFSPEFGDVFGDLNSTENAGLLPKDNPRLSKTLGDARALCLDN